MFDRQKINVAVIGAGIAGQIAAIAFAQSNHKIICVDPAPLGAGQSDLRSTAFLQPARQLLQDIGVWDRLAKHATPLQCMRLIDRGHGEGKAKDFDAGEISNDPFAWNLPNSVIRRELQALMGTLPNLDFRSECKLTRMLPRTRGSIIGLSDGSSIETNLIIAADGRNSKVREFAEIDTKTTKFDQMAVVFVVQHQTPHLNSSIEIHRSGGPFTLVPLPIVDGVHRSAVVWMDATHKARAYYEMPSSAFNDAINERAGGVLGQLELVGDRAIWPIIAQLAERIIAPSTAIIAEAAHVVPPIGAQGLNMSLADIETLVSLAKTHEVGSVGMLQAYEKARYSDIKRRVEGVTLLNKASISGQPIVQAARSAGLNLLHGVRPIRQTLMRMGLGQSSD
ncbi:MAG: FAD-dependent monooxygenase [Paracoccaceae bacterium]|nr:FAD-dependent monooxygenase [Paracoccaceae bacterium]